MASAKSLTLLLTLLAATPLYAQKAPAVQFTDPANLRGERVKPRDGRELPIDQGARGLEQMLRRLNTRASLMLIVAHPDDEDGGMLTYYSRGLGARVAVLTLTRGEGGQNAMTGDFEDALGLLRTQELLSADRYLGVDQFFGTEVDFGFSKTKEESFAKWTHERVLYDAVRSIRLYRPLVIAAVFIGGVTDGHGQHQVSGQIAQEAFKAAADPAVFPDMIAEGILPWQALKVYARVPTQSISDKGLFDYATGKFTAPRFENYVTGEVTTTPPSVDVVVHEGTVDPILSDNPTDPPRTYVQFARIGLGLQKSQIGPNVRLPPAGAFDVSYHLYGSVFATSASNPKGRHPERSEGSATPHAAASPLEPSSQNPDTASFFDGIDTSVQGLASGLSIPANDALGQAILSQIDAIGEELRQCQDWNNNQATSRDLAVALGDIINRNNAVISWLETDNLPAGLKATLLHELRVKKVQLDDALALSLGLDFDAKVVDAMAGDVVAGAPVDVRTSLTMAAAPHVPDDVPAPTIRLTAEYVKNDQQQAPANHIISLPLVEYVTHDEQLKTDGRSPISRPYFSRKDIEQPFYDLSQPALRNAPQTPPALTAFGSLHYEGLGTKFDFEIGRVVHDGDQPVSIVPPVSLNLSSYAQILLRYREPGFGITATLRGGAALPLPMVQLTGPKGWSITSLPSPSPSETEFEIVPPRVQNIPKATFSASVAIPRAGTYSEGYRPVGYPGLVSTNYFTPATDRVVPLELKLPQGYPAIAYLPGTGDAISTAIKSMGLNPVTILTVTDLTPTNLAHYDTVILGVRTYNAHPDLHGAPTQALLDYARNGGNVLVQYQTAEFTAADAPYPLSLGSNERVVDETDPVQLLEPTSPLLLTPNQITPADFNNWIEERGHGFLSTWDSHYIALTETHDPDQDPQRGGLITTQLGKGRWTYCAFALYRQLPEAVPGAYRLFVNLLNPDRLPK